MKHTPLLGALLVALATQISWAQIPKTMSYQGALKDTDGSPVSNGDYQVGFRLYDVESGGMALWEEVHQSVPVTNGFFGAILGGSDPLDLPFDRQYWLGITVEGGAELTPRVQLTAVPYSLNSQRAASACRVLPSVHSFRLDDVNTYQRIPFDLEDYDLGDEFDTAAHRFTAKRAGIYSVKLMGHWNGSGGPWILLTVFKNGQHLPVPPEVWWKDQFSYHSYNTGTWQAVSYGMDVQLNAGEFIELYGKSQGCVLNGYSMVIHKVQ